MNGVHSKFLLLQLLIFNSSNLTKLISKIIYNLLRLGLTAPSTPLAGPPSYKAGPASISAALGSEGQSPASVAPATPRSQQSSVPPQDTTNPVPSPQSGNDNLPMLSSESVGQKFMSSAQSQVSQFTACTIMLRITFIKFIVIVEFLASNELLRRC